MTPTLVAADRSESVLAPLEPLPAPVPTFTGAQMAEAFTAYQQLQRTLDDSMPDQIIEIEGRRFRKKGYWRAIAVAFNLTVEPIDERRDVQGTFEDGQENFGWIVTYRARTATGRSATGDGACFAIEKAPRAQANRWAQLPKPASEHNVRSHACTRAFNRAVSNLVGFGEVSAEEVVRDGDDSARRSPDIKKITGPQTRRLFAIAREHGWSPEQLQAHLLAKYSLRRANDLLDVLYDRVIRELQLGPQPAPVPTAADKDQPF